jgi:hypothetical protein
MTKIYLQPMLEQLPSSKLPPAWNSFNLAAFSAIAIDSLRPKGHAPFMVRRVRSLPVGYHERAGFL